MYFAFFVRVNSFKGGEYPSKQEVYLTKNKKEKEEQCYTGQYHIDKKKLYPVWEFSKI